MYRGTISRTEWGAVAPTQNAGPQEYDAGLIIHWEGPKMWGDLWAFAHDSCYEKVRGIQRYHINAGYSDIAYNDVICPHGYIFNGRSGVNMANAASGDWWVNHHTEAACMLWGDGDDHVLENNPDVIDAINALRNYGMAFAGMSAEVRPHRAIISTACPGDSLTYVAGLLNGSGMQSVGTDSVAPAPAPVPPVVAPAPSTDPVLSISDPGPTNFSWYVADWQNWLNVSTNAGIDADGFFGPATENAVKNFQAFWHQYNNAIDVDGIIGPQTWDLRRFTDYLNSQPATTPTTDSAPKPDPSPTPPPPPAERLFTDDEIQVLCDAVIIGMGWDYMTSRRQKKLDKIADLLRKLTK